MQGWADRRGRDGNLLLIVSGSPALVDRHLNKALAKATAKS
ncbi:hypothetical protein [Streptomyces sp. NPDC092370]